MWMCDICFLIMNVILWVWGWICLNIGLLLICVLEIIKLLILIWFLGFWLGCWVFFMVFWIIFLSILVLWLGWNCKILSVLFVNLLWIMLVNGLIFWGLMWVKWCDVWNVIFFNFFELFFLLCWWLNVLIFLFG